MHYKKLASMNIAVIGNNETAKELALSFATAGHQVYLASTDQQYCVADILSGITHTDIETAAQLGDMVFLAVKPDEVREAAYWLGDVRRKVIIDVTANVEMTGEVTMRTIAAIKSITGSQHVVKAFYTRGYENILKPLFNGQPVDIILIGDSKKAKEITKIMAIETGLNYFYDFGTCEHIALFNEMTACWRKLRLNAVNEKANITE